MPPEPSSLLDRMNQLRIAEHLYREPRGRRERWRTAVLVIDEQWEVELDGQDFSLTRAKDPVSTRQQTVVEMAAKWNWPIVFVQFWTASQYRADTPLPPPALDQTAEPVRFDAGAFPVVCHVDRRLVKAVGPRSFETFTKIGKSPFRAQVLRRTQEGAEWADFDDWLERQQILQLVVIGQAVNWCVQATVEDALERLYIVLTCSQTMWGTTLGNDARWKNTTAAEFYDSL